MIPTDKQELTPKQIVEKEVSRQKEFGYEPSWEDFVIAGMDALKAMGYEQAWEKCPECKGRGKKYELLTNIPGADGSALSNCPTCKGTDKVINKVKWDREKVFSWLCRTFPKTNGMELEGWADQLKKELTTGGSNAL